MNNSATHTILSSYHSVKLMEGSVELLCQGPLAHISEKHGLLLQDQLACSRQVQLQCTAEISTWHLLWRSVGN